MVPWYYQGRKRLPGAILSIANAYTSHTKPKAEVRKRNPAPKATSMRHPCDLKATFMRVASQAVGTHKPPSSHPHAILKPPTSHPHASLKPPQSHLETNAENPLHAAKPRNTPNTRKANRRHAGVPSRCHRRSAIHAPGRPVLCEPTRLRRKWRVVRALRKPYRAAP